MGWDPFAGRARHSGMHRSALNSCLFQKTLHLAQMREINHLRRNIWDKAGKAAPFDRRPPAFSHLRATSSRLCPHPAAFDPIRDVNQVHCVKGGKMRVIEHNPVSEFWPDFVLPARFLHPDRKTGRSFAQPSTLNPHDTISQRTTPPPGYGKRSNRLVRPPRSNHRPSTLTHVVPMSNPATPLPK
jgi:hypothetical protein